MLNISVLRRSRAMLCKWAAALTLLGLFGTPSANADLFVVDGSGVVNRYNSTNGAVIQTNGQNTFANVDSPTGITVGPDGLVYVGNSNSGLDSDGGAVNRYNATTGAQVGGAFIPFANGSSQLSNPQGMAFGPDGNLYIADEGDNGPVKSFNNTGGFLASYATTGGNAQAVAFNSASPGNIYVATGSTIEQINIANHNDSILIQGDSDTFSDGADLAFGPDGKLYVLDISGSTPQILRYNANGTGQTVFTNFASGSFAPADFEPAAMAFGPDGRLYVSGLSLDSLNPQQGEILQLSADGSTSNEFITNLNSPGFLAFTAVPEPTTLPIIGVTLLLLRRRRKLRRK